MVARDEPDGGGDGGIGRPGTERAHELGEGGGRILGGGEGQLEEVPQHHQVGWVLARSPKGPQAVAERRQHR